ncbi:MerR family transcriptional regulator [Paenibacillus riograndensis]|uniref:MerR-family transcriptional regulator n=1 Tax=Paenibacillus riograndensis SBR5 TaxID=1073571 RepID=A0A0E4H630_9BACL|nr:MerR family transcriptional regulator [Paenibacillus riograndensis]CQR51571.1 MerR-family transcriptional regulator [Paenibacillus riograndensis SBR5]
MYRTKEIAAMVGVHPNTVRIYEEWGYISAVPRGVNGYRMYSDLHLFQLKIARTAFRCEIVQGLIRAKARAIVEASGKADFTQALEYAHAYLSHLEKEYSRALEAIELSEQWVCGIKATPAQTYTRKETALVLDLSTEVVRNWERNGLITVHRLSNGSRVYTENEIKRLKMIRTLRTAHYSISAILRLMNQAEHMRWTNLNIKEVLNTPEEHEDIISVTDRLVYSLEQAIESAKELISMLRERLNLEI